MVSVPKDHVDPHGQFPAVVVPYPIVMLQPTVIPNYYSEEEEDDKHLEIQAIVSWFLYPMTMLIHIQASPQCSLTISMLMNFCLDSWTKCVQLSSAMMKHSQANLVSFIVIYINTLIVT